MENHVHFDINEALKNYLNDPATIATPEADEALQSCENDPEALTSGLIQGVLDPIIDTVAENADALAERSTFESIQFLLKCAPAFLESNHRYSHEPDSELFQICRSTSMLPVHSLSKIFDLIISGLSSEADLIYNDVDTEDQDVSQQQRTVLEMYAFLLQWCISAAEVKALEKSTGPAPKGRGAGKGAKAKGSAKDSSWDPSMQEQAALDTMCKVLKLKLGKIFVTTSERDTFVGLFTRPAWLILESEQRVKNTALRMHVFKVLCIAVKHHGHAFGTLFC